VNRDDNIAKRLVPLTVLLITLAITYFVYQPGLSGTFVLDDYHTIANNAHVAIADLTPQSLKQAAFSYGRGLFRRPVSMLSFAANYYTTGFHPFYFKTTNLFIHLLNGIGIFVLTSSLLDIYRKRFQLRASLANTQWISLAVTAAWLLHPFNLTSVLYVVQRMSSLAAFFSIWGLVFFVWGRIRLYEGRSGEGFILASLFLFAPLATLSKENGALLPLLIFVIEFTIFGFQAEKQSAQRFLAAFYALTVAAPIVVFLIYTLIHPMWLADTYQTRDFTLSERLMTEARVLWFYMRQVILPNNAQMGLFHDDIVISRGILQPANTVFSMIGVLALIVVAVLARKKAPLFACGILFFFAGHALESTVWPLEIAYEHRNYLPMYGLVLILFYYLLYPLSYLKNLRLRQVVTMLLIGLFAFNTHSRANQWANPFDLARLEVEHHSNSLRANAEMANLYSTLSSTDPKAMEEYYLLAGRYYENMSNIDSNDIHGLIGLIVLNASRGKPIEPAWINKLRNRLERAPIPINIGHKLEGLVSCQINKICNFTHAEIEGLLQAPMHNPTVTGLRRAAVFSAFGYYLINVKQDYPAALAALRQTIEIAPLEIPYRLTFASFLSALQNDREAKDQLNIVKSLDKLNIHTAEIEEQSKLLYSQNK
jgi:hypothetical protein